MRNISKQLADFEERGKCGMVDCYFCNPQTKQCMSKKAHAQCMDILLTQLSIRQSKSDLRYDTPVQPKRGTPKKYCKVRKYKFSENAMLLAVLGVIKNYVNIGEAAAMMHMSHATFTKYANEIIPGDILVRLYGGEKPNARNQNNQ